MIHELKPYPAMKNSGVPWLGEVPEHWDVLRSRYLVREVDQRSSTGTETHLSMSQRLGLVPSSEMQERRLVSESYIGAKLCEPGDLVLNRLKAHLGVFARASQAGLVSFDYTVFRRISPRVSMSFFEPLLKSPACRGELRTRAKGLVEGFWRLYTDDFYTIRLPLPPVHEQSAIVRFLEHADRRIRRYILAKQKLIKLLEEQKQAIIHRAVTRGLDPNVRLKRSGIEWLGDVPEQWEVVLNQRIFKEEIRPHGGKPETQLSLSQKDGLIATSEMREWSLQTSTYDNWKLTLPGDLVLNRFKAHLGVFFASTLRGIVSFHYGVFTPRRDLVVKYFELLYHTNVFRTIYAGRSNGMTVGLQNLSNQNFYNTRSVVPPVQEQAQIVEFVEKATERLNEAVKDASREVDLLREYRTCLIADVVTGKLDVREAAANLPAETEESELPLASSELDEEPDVDLLDGDAEG